MTGWETDPLRIVQEIEFWMYYQIVFEQICPKEWGV